MEFALPPHHFFCWRVDCDGLGTNAPCVIQDGSPRLAWRFTLDSAGKAQWKRHYKDSLSRSNSYEMPSGRLFRSFCNWAPVIWFTLRFTFFTLVAGPTPHDSVFPRRFSADVAGAWQVTSGAGTGPPKMESGSGDATPSGCSPPEGASRGVGKSEPVVGG